jgi:formylglycine-generating enzyme required for sulfatase activity/energy-coupling factor transporter ATP-binding protein EcfA2
MPDEIRYDVFLSHNNADREAVEIIARRLREEAQVAPFLDRWHLVPGEPWQEALEEALDASRTCAVFLGPAGLGTWENEEMRAALDIRAGRLNYRVIPVLLPGARLPERGRLPRFLARFTWVDFRSGLDDARAFYELVCGIQGVAPGPEGVTEVEAVCPFRGLQVFDEEHARFFFGREALTQHLVEQLRGDRFLAVVGPSGSGKSSLVRAGLVPQIRSGALPASDRWPVVLFKPGPHPLETLAARLVPHLDGGADPLAAQGLLLDTLRRGERGLHGAVQVALAAASDNQRLLLVVDQFEEMFTLCHDESARAAFIANLLYGSAIAGGQTVAVVTMRADFFGKCAAYPELAVRLAERDVLVGPMSEEELQRAMEGPAQAVGLHYEKGLVDAILDDLGDEPGTLPLLQHTLLELWERRRGGWLTTDAYREIGGVKGALAQRADEVYAGLTTAQREAARRVLLRLTEPGEGTEDTRRRATLTELLPAEGGTADVETAVQALADARLLTTGKNEQGNEIVDVSHEALIRGWPRLQGWIDEDRAALRTHRRLTEASIEWGRHASDESYLYRGARLAEAEEWAEIRTDDLNELEHAFLDASLTLREQEAAEKEAQRQRELEAARRLAEEAEARRRAEGQRAQEAEAREREQRKAANILRWLVVILTLIALVAPGLWAYRQILRAMARGPVVHLPVSRAVIGSNSDLANADERPVWTVEIPAFDIERYEVTNRQYRLCVMAGTCAEPQDVSLYASTDRSDHPVVMVNAHQAVSYCRWLGRRLPTELEWERTARGSEGRPWPWGEDPPDSTRLNILFDEGAVEDTRPVGSYPGGATPEGVFDMAGNVWEWTATIYQPYPYDLDAAAWDGDLTNAPEQLVTRGGGWQSTFARPTVRTPALPTFQWEDLGFRCARTSR